MSHLIIVTLPLLQSLYNVRLPSLRSNICSSTFGLTFNSYGHPAGEATTRFDETTTMMHDNHKDEDSHRRRSFTDHEAAIISG